MSTHPRLTVAEFLDRVPWATMRVMRSGFIRTRHHYPRCPIAAVTGQEIDHAHPEYGGARLGLRPRDVELITIAADVVDYNSSPQDRKARDLRKQMLARLAAARGARV